MEVQRTNQQRMICVCRIKRGHGHDSCASYTSGPDEPVCEFCVAARHPQDDNWDPTIKPIPEVRLSRYSTRPDGNGGFIIEPVVQDA